MDEITAGADANAASDSILSLFYKIPFDRIISLDNCQIVEFHSSVLSNETAKESIQPLESFEVDSSFHSYILSSNDLTKEEHSVLIDMNHQFQQHCFSLGDEQNQQILNLADETRSRSNMIPENNSSNFTQSDLWGQFSNMDMNNFAIWNAFPGNPPPGQRNARQIEHQSQQQQQQQQQQQPQQQQQNEETRQSFPSETMAANTHFPMSFNSLQNSGFPHEFSSVSSSFFPIDPNLIFQNYENNPYSDNNNGRFMNIASASNCFSNVTENVAPRPSIKGTEMMTLKRKRNREAAAKCRNKKFNRIETLKKISQQNQKRLHELTEYIKKREAYRAKLYEAVMSIKIKEFLEEKEKEDTFKEAKQQSQKQQQSTN